MRKSSIIGGLMMAVAASFGMPTRLPLSAPLFAQPHMPPVPRSRAAGAVRKHRSNGRPSYTAAQLKRASRKARNRARHKAHVRGR